MGPQRNCLYAQQSAWYRWMSLLCINWPLWNATRFEPSQPNINQEGRFWGLEDSSKKRLSSSLPRAGAGEAEAGVWWSGRPQRPIRECTILSLELCKLEMPVEVFQKIYIRMPASSRILMSGIMVLVQLLSCVQLFVTPWTAAGQTSMSFTISWCLLKLMSIEAVMP